MTKTVVLRLAVLATTLIVTACATDLRNVRLGAPVEAEVIPGKIFVPIKSTNVGDVMFIAGEYSRDTTGRKLEVFRVVNGAVTHEKHKGRTFEFSIPAGDYRLRSKSSEGNYYSAPAAFTGVNGTETEYGGLFVPHGESTATDLFWNWQSEDNGSFFQAKLSSPITGSTTESIVYKNGSDPRARLTYAGVAGGQIHFVYKEFTADGLARPAFTQEVGLDYKPGSTYGYKSAKFIVEEADSTHVTFKILEPL